MVSEFKKYQLDQFTALKNLGFKSLNFLQASVGCYGKEFGEGGSIGTFSERKLLFGSELLPPYFGLVAGDLYYSQYSCHYS